MSEFLGTVKNATVSIQAQVFVWLCVSLPLWHSLWDWNCRLQRELCVRANDTLPAGFPERLHHFIIAPAVGKGSSLSTSSSLIIICLFYCAHFSDHCVCGRGEPGWGYLGPLQTLGSPDAESQVAMVSLSWEQESLSNKLSFSVLFCFQYSIPKPFILGWEEPHAQLRYLQVRYTEPHQPQKCGLQRARSVEEFGRNYLGV